MDQNDLLIDPLFELESPTGLDRTDLPGLLAALGDGRALSMPRLQRHQEEAFHIFLCYLAAAVLVRNGQSKPGHDVTFWREGLRSLAREAGDLEGNSWRLVVDDPCQPGFLQPPVTERAGFRHYGPKAETPDELDRLITAKNHDVKSKRCVWAEREDWVYALVSLQTMSGYGGRGNYGIARMNSGAGSRPVVGLVPHGTWSTRWCVDVKRLVRLREGLLQGPWGYQPRGIVLTWVPAWDLEASLPLHALDPYFVEVARAVRLLEREGCTVAYAAGSQAPRLAAKAALGNLGDPWIPVQLEGKNGPQALTIAGGLSARLLRNLIFFEDGGYHPAAMQLPSPELDALPVKFAASVLIGGQSTTDGFHHVEIPIPDRVRTLLFTAGAQRDSLALRSRHALETAGRFELKVLKPAVFSFIEAAGGDRKIDYKDPSIQTRWQRVSRDFTASWSAGFFPWLWASADVTRDDESIAIWLGELHRCGRNALDTVMRGYPQRRAQRYRSRAVADGVYVGSLRKQFPQFKEASHGVQPD